MTIAFLGDSITAGGDWASWFPGRDARNLGVPGDTTANVLDRLDGWRSWRRSSTMVRRLRQVGKRR
jgi:hypothetical protein